jgi:hypothetical protein
VRTQVPPGAVDGPDVVLPGSEQLAPVFWGLVALIAVLVAAGAWMVRRRRRRTRPGSVPPRPVVTTVALASAAAAVVLVALTWPPAFRTPEFPPLGRILPEGAFFHRAVEDLPLAEEGPRWIGSFSSEPLIAAFGGEPQSGVVFGIPFNPVDSSTPRREVRIRLWPAKSYLGAYPIAEPAYIESMPTYGLDNHYVAIDREARTMWELLGARVWFGRWEADSGARWDLDDLRYPPAATMASGLPLLPGVLTYDEVAAGRVDHVIHAGTPTTRPGAFVWPARATDGRSDHPDAPPMGAWLRLRADVDVSELGPQARVVAEGLKRYGLVLSDTGPHLALRGTPDARWDRNDLRTLGSLTAADFEVVDASGLMVDPGSMEAKAPSR